MGELSGHVCLVPATGALASLPPGRGSLRILLSAVVPAGGTLAVVLWQLYSSCQGDQGNMARAEPRAHAHLGNIRAPRGVPGTLSCPSRVGACPPLLHTPLSPCIGTSELPTA